MTILIIALFVCQATFAASQFTCDPLIDCNSLDTPSYVPDPEDCTKFHRCLKDPVTKGLYYHEEPSLGCFSGSYLNVKNGQCTCEPGSCTRSVCLSEDKTCKTSCAELNGDEGTIMYPGDCTQYYYCFYVSIHKPMSTSLKKCAPGELFTGDKCEKVDKDKSCCNMCGDPLCDSSDDTLLSATTAGNSDSKKSKALGSKTDKNANGCVNVNEFVCPYKGNFPICTECSPDYISCEYENDNLTAVKTNCQSGSYFYPHGGFMPCMAMDMCSDLLGYMNENK